MRRTVTVLVLAAAVLPVGAAALAAPSIDTLELGHYSPAQMKLFYQLDGVDGESEGELGVDVTGPNGQVNHGSIVSAFIAALREDGIEGGIGCAVSSLARTDLGRTEETKVRVPDAETVAPTADVADVAEPADDIDLSDVENRCQETEDGDTEGDEPGKGKGKGKGTGTGTGKPEWAGAGATADNPGRSHRP